MDEKRGIIRKIIAHGGLIKLTLEHNGLQHEVWGDNGPTVRALRGLFGDDITSGRLVNINALLGKEIGYSVDEQGILAYVFEPRATRS